MLPELIYREEKHQDFGVLFVLGLLSGILGFAAARFLFPSQLDVLAVIFASIPLVYPLTRFFFEDEENGRPHIPEVETYGSIFVGEVAAFFCLGLLFPDAFSLQSQIVGASGFATASASFSSILSNNLVVFGAILALAAIIGSSGSFILTWNASVLGVFFAKLVSAIESGAGLLTCQPTPSPVCYLPHATFEMTGFIIAGVSGSLISAALYREHFDRETWRDYLKLVGVGVLLILVGALLETA